MRSAIRPTAYCVAVLTAGLALTGCTGTQPDAAPASSSTGATSTGAASTGASSTAASSGAAGVGTDSEETKKWCATYSAIAANLGSMGQTPEEAKAGLKLLATFDRLWVSAGQLELVTQDEVDANRATVSDYGEIMKLVADGATEEEIRAADQVHCGDREA
jgi:hypothetical protein